MKVMRQIFSELAEALPEKQIAFDDNNDIDGLRSQISLLRSRVQSGISAIYEAIGERPPETARADEPRVIEPSKAADKRRVFVVHGRNIKARDAMFAFLRAVDLNPMEWGEVLRNAMDATPYIGDALDKAFSQVQAAVVILTGDDVARAGKNFLLPHDSSDERDLTPQARPNVLFEAGMAFGRSARSTVLVSVGRTRPFSDITGRHILNLSDSVASRQELVDRLHKAGCAVKTENKNDWHTAGSFEAANVPADPSAPLANAGLTITRKHASYVEKETCKPKVWVEVRNDSDEALIVRNLGWNKSPAGINIKSSSGNLQLRIGTSWCPENGAETLHIPPGETFRTWVQPAPQHDMAELSQRCEGDHAVATLVLNVNSGRVHLAV